MLIGDILNKLQKVKRLTNGQYQARCPAHDDTIPSLSLRQEGNKILMHCQAGCPIESIMAKLGLQMNDLFIDESISKEKIITTYDYQDESNNLLFQVVRYDPKSFKQRRKNSNGEWQWDVQGIHKVIYHLPDIMRVTTDTIYWVEGEKDVDKLWDAGLIATTSPGGVNGWKPEYVQYLQGKRVVIIPDNDAPGYSYAKEVTRSLIGKANIKCILLDKAKDISDWLEQGNDIEQLPLMEQDISTLLDPDKPKYEQNEDFIVWNKTIADHTITFRAESIRQERTGIHARLSILCDYTALAWSLFNIERSEDRTKLANSAHKQLKGNTIEVYSNKDLRSDLDTFCLGLWDYRIASFMPELLSGDDEPKPLKFLLRPYIVEGGGTILFAPPGRGKSYSALLWAVAINNGIDSLWAVTQVPTLFINLERSKQSVRRRLATVNKVMGLPANHHLLILNARGKSLLDIMPICRKTIKQYGIKFIVLDSISRAGFGDLTENRPVNTIIDSLSSLCDTWLALAHTPRANEGHIYGGIHFDAGADIVIQLSSEINNEGVLGIGYQITKANDLPMGNVSIFAFEFDEAGLTVVRKAKQMEFPNIASRQPSNILDDVRDFILNQDTADATATQIENALGYNRPTVSKLFTQSGKFIQTRKDKQSVYYGVKE